MSGTEERLLMLIKLIDGQWVDFAEVHRIQRHAPDGLVDKPQVLITISDDRIIALTFERFDVAQQYADELAERINALGSPIDMLARSPRGVMLLPLECETRVHEHRYSWDMVSESATDCAVLKQLIEKYPEHGAVARTLLELINLVKSLR
jgi:hypothetical protein